jgi:hypothetical protein
MLCGMENTFFLFCFDNFLGRFSCEKGQTSQRKWQKNENTTIFQKNKHNCYQWELNPRPLVYETSALLLSYGSLNLIFQALTESPFKLEALCPGWFRDFSSLKTLIIDLNVWTSRSHLIFFCVMQFAKIVLALHRLSGKSCSTVI